MAGFSGSLVANILQKGSILDEKVIDENILKLTKQLGQLKGDIVDTIRQQYVDFDSYVESSQSLERQLRDILRDHKRLSTRVETDLQGKLANVVDQRPALETKLKESQNRINLVQKLVVVYLGIENARKTLGVDKLACARAVLDATKSLQGLAEENCNAQVYKTLQTELADVMAQLISKLSEEWCNHVQWKNAHKLSVELIISPGAMLEDIVRAMKLLPAANVWPDNRKMFAQKLFSMFIRPLITSQEPLSVLLSTKEDSKSLTIVSQPHKGSISDLYADLTTVLTTVRGMISIGDEWMTGLGDVVCVDMCQLIVAHRLSVAIPRDSQELANYDTLSSQTKEFENGLVEVGLAKEGACQTLTQYTKQVNSHFAAQKSQDLFAKARSVLLQPLHKTVTITDDKALQQLHNIVMGDHKEGDLSGLSFSFPQCVVSKCVVEYVDLLYSTLRECCVSPAPLAAQLFSTCRGMIDLFCGVISSHHSQAITDVPGVAMTQHNNCLYLAHHLLTLGHQFYSLLPLPLDSQIASFVDFVPIVRKLGENVFERELKKQSATLLDILASFGSLDNVSETEQSQTVQQAIQRVVLHATKLGQVYAEILPQEIHCRAVGGLLNVVVRELVKAVLSLEDIAVDNATELHAILTQFLQHAPGALTIADAQLVTVYCQDWDRLRELTVVLNASLLKIVDLWDRGAGVLGQTFTAMELRGLIKALFKNTDRRATAIAKITL